MQGVVDRLSQFATDAMYLLKIVDAGTRNALQTAELPEQIASLAWAQPGNGFKNRLSACFGTT